MHDVEKRLRLAAEPLQSAAPMADAAVYLMIKRLGLHAQTLGGGGERHDVLPVETGGRCFHPPPAGGYPPREHFQRELEELIDRKEEGDLTARQLRRIAELVEVLDGEDASLPWWIRAAEAGDGLAAAAVAHLHP